MRCWIKHREQLQSTGGYYQVLIIGSKRRLKKIRKENEEKWLYASTRIIIILGNLYIYFSWYVHCYRLLELSALLDLEHQITAVHVFHNEVQPVLKGFTINIFFLSHYFLSRASFFDHVFLRCIALSPFTSFLSLNLIAGKHLKKKKNHRHSNCGL